MTNLQFFITLDGEFTDQNGVLKYNFPVSCPKSFHILFMHLLILFVRVCELEERINLIT